MNLRSAALITLPTYFVLYAPQPLLPSLAVELGVSESRVALLMSAALLPLAIAPLLYGLVLSRVSARRVLAAGITGLGICVLAFAVLPGFVPKLLARLGQGLLLPAVLTALMTAISSNVRPERLQRVMSAYVAATIVGGFGGRVLAGAAATWADWHLFFYFNAALLFASLLALRGLPARAPVRVARPSPRALAAVWRASGNGYLFAAIFCLFFVFVGLLNYLPFRVKLLEPEVTEFGISLLYAGYLMGLVSALTAHRVIARLGGRHRALLLGYSLYVAALLGTLAPSIGAVLVVLFIFCWGMFLVHSIASAQVNRTETEHRGVINGLYVSSYYAGGVLGSYLPGLIYERWGWGVMVPALAAVGAAGIALVALHGRRIAATLGSAPETSPASER